ncbi:hypothetical protein SELMODRAFT_413347 [Selaginella moellendorffii]|uniref:Uncharacterized protein n=1 Tax=Selaginella moellendorffii TaxID=88036 RepID=D8RP63_SELML|nr:hypothetical protein SELMODRAFT_413347 [Selaginella moellendorffii]
MVNLQQCCEHHEIFYLKNLKRDSSKTLRRPELRHISRALGTGTEAQAPALRIRSELHISRLGHFSTTELAHTKVEKGGVLGQALGFMWTRTSPNYKLLEEWSKQCTDANVDIIFTSLSGVTLTYRNLDHTNYDDFERCSTDVFDVQVHFDMGIWLEGDTLSYVSDKCKV